MDRDGSCVRSIGNVDLYILSILYLNIERLGFKIESKRSYLLNDEVVSYSDVGEDNLAVLVCIRSDCVVVKSLFVLENTVVIGIPVKIESYRISFIIGDNFTGPKIDLVYLDVYSDDVYNVILDCLLVFQIENSILISVITNHDLRI